MIHVLWGCPPTRSVKRVGQVKPVLCTARQLQPNNNSNKKENVHVQTKKNVSKMAILREIARIMSKILVWFWFHFL